MNNPGSPILLIDDSPEDAVATSRALRRANLANPVYHCATGDEGLDFLFQRNQYAETGKAPRPGIILLDLNMPGTDGREVLSQIKQDESLKRIPVVVLTTSSDERDIETCYEIGSNSYITKPVDFDGFMMAIQRLTDYWFEVVILPKGIEQA